jgi:hypothetical protein
MEAPAARRGPELTSIVRKPTKLPQQERGGGDGGKTAVALHGAREASTALRTYE